MKKFCTVLLLCALLAALTACASPRTDWTPLPLARAETEDPSPAQGETIAAAFSVTEPFGGVELEFHVQDNASITVSIYAADKDYRTSLSQKPKREETIENLTESVLWNFRTLPAGSYLIVFSQGKNAAVKKAAAPSDEANGKILHYRNGEIMTDGICMITLLCRRSDPAVAPAFTPFTYPVIVEEE